MMPGPALLTNATTADGFLLVLAIVLPVIGILLLFACGGRYVERIVFFLIPIGLGVAIAVFAAIWRGGRSLIYIVGGWEPPLGIALRADGLSAAMMITVGVVIGATALFAREEFGQPRQRPSPGFVRVLDPFVGDLVGPEHHRR
jgi:multicomponent Na+:H+ antiporter subunit D